MRPNYFKRYVWDDDKTPYRIAVAKLKKKQADSEIFAYVCFFAVLSAVLGVISCAPNAPFGQSYGAAFYAFSVATSAIWLHMSKEALTALYCAIAPVAVLLYLLIGGFTPGTPMIDSVVIIVACILIAWYSTRIVAIAKHYENLPE